MTRLNLSNTLEYTPGGATIYHDRMEDSSTARVVAKKFKDRAQSQFLNDPASLMVA